MSPRPESSETPTPAKKIAMTDHLFSRGMVESWQHGAACTQALLPSCICGLSALQAMVQPFRIRAFNVIATEV